MSATILYWSLLAAQALLVLAMACAAYRIIRGPRAQDRVLGLDTLYVNATMLLLTVGMRTGTTLFFESALVISLVGFASTAAFAKFLMRGEVVE